MTGCQRWGAWEGWIGRTQRIFRAVKILSIMLQWWTHVIMLLWLRCFSHVQLCDPIDIARQAPLSMGFSRQEYWRGLPCLPPEDLPNPGIKLSSLTSPALAGRSFTSCATWEAHVIIHCQSMQWTVQNVNPKENYVWTLGGLQCTVNRFILGNKYIFPVSDIKNREFVCIGAEIYVKFLNLPFNFAVI